MGIGQEKKTLLQVIDFHNAKYKEKVDKEKRADSTLKKWHTTKDKLQAFMKAVFKLPDIPLEKVEYSFAEDFFDFLILTQGMQDNTAMKYLKNTKQILKLATQRKWLPVTLLQDYVCSYVNPERDILSIDELSALYYKEIKISRLAEARDAYVLIADICGIPKNLTTHTARHTFATTVTLANGVPLETVSAMLGHKQIYAKIVARKLSNDMQALKGKFELVLAKSLLSEKPAA